MKIAPRRPHHPARASAMTFARLLISGALVLALQPRTAAAFLSCDATTLQGVAPAGTTIASATMHASPSYCDVLGKIATASEGQNNTVIFELGLPSAWLGDFVMIGNGGFAGSLQAVTGGEFIGAVDFGLAAAATDTGHESALGPLGSLDGSFGLVGNEPAFAAREDFSYRAVHLTALAGKAITMAYYGVPGMFSYFDGCSTGGRQALVEAQKFPTDFNGIVAGDPAIGDPIAGFNWNDQALLKSSAGYLTPENIELVDRAVLEECDGLDGMVDGLIQDPRKCHFDPRSLMCAGGNQTDCLNNQQVKTLQAIYSGAVTNGKRRLYPGYMASDPGGPDGWAQWITGFVPPQFAVANPWGAPPASLAVAPLQWSFQDQFLKYFVFDDPAYDSLGFNFRHKSDVSALNSIVTEFRGNGENIDLAPFFNAGGKLVMYHGWSDPALTPRISVDYYTAVARLLYGGDFSRLQANARLFMVPGMHHCAGGPGPNVFDPLTPLIEWVQFGVPPVSIVAAHFVDNDPTKPVDRTMPLCPYPQRAKYIGGVVTQASSWVCANPQ
ncbi:MAG TPA: tannase/feruloyl esterase family alpha/beta hydrolase [Candidatus Binataceae bacterium]|nr:tannase/feruloyl esterase family alpha/beta hydrolase [Candidatus Binataceae bacterium]